jgi:hypothetical protein
MKQVVLTEIILSEEETVSSLRKKLARKHHHEHIITLTPEQAQLMLDNFRPNRTPGKSHVDKFIKIFLMGEFRPTSLLHVDQKGRTANGSHRLRAQIAADKTQQYQIQLGLTEQEVSELDMGDKPRVTKDVLITSEIPKVKKLVQGSPTRARMLGGVLQSMYPLLISERNFDLNEGFALLDYFYEDLNWALNETTVKLVDRLPVRVAATLAHHFAANNDQLDDLNRAITCLKTGQDARGLLLGYREYLHTLRTGRRNRSSPARDPYEAVLNKSLRMWQLYFTGQNESGKKTKLQMVSDLGGMVVWFLGESKEEASRKMGLHPTRQLLRELRLQEAAGEG